jgi:membrane complex biogenesis BtpA family protein
MRAEILQSIFKTFLPVIGVVHLPPLPGAPKYSGESVEDITKAALAEAKTLVDNGIDGIIIENFNDIPFLKRVGPETVAAVTYIGKAIKDRFTKPLGICLLQADTIGAIAIAKTLEAEFIRATYYTETYVVDAGLIDSSAAEVQRFRAFLKCQTKVFADVHIKHGYPLAQRPIELSAEDALFRGLADALIITGLKTGGETKVEDVKRVREKLPEAPLIVGSGVTVENVNRYLPFVDGIIVSTGLKLEGKEHEVFDPARVSKLMEKVADYRKKNKEE